MTVQERSARLALNSLSKGALADIVVDMLRRESGDETLDGDALVRLLADAFEPIAAVRGDKPIKK